MHRTHAGHGSIWPAETSGKPVEARASDQSTLTPERIAELRGLAEKATPGPWERVDNAAYALNDEGTNRMYLNVFGGYEIQRRNGISVRTAGAEITANAALIAAMRNALPDLLDAAERASRAREDALREAIEICKEADAQDDRDNGAAATGAACNAANAILALINKPKGGDANEQRNPRAERTTQPATSPGVTSGASDYDPVMAAETLANGIAVGNRDTFDLCRDALTRARDVGRRAMAAGWQPIESAPVDLNVLLYCPNLGVANPERIELGPAHTSRGSHHSWATMWMPLPAAPVDGGEDA